MWPNSLGGAATPKCSGDSATDPRRYEKRDAKEPDGSRIGCVAGARAETREQIMALCAAARRSRISAFRSAQNVLRNAPNAEREKARIQKLVYEHIRAHNCGGGKTTKLPRALRSSA